MKWLRRLSSIALIVAAASISLPSRSAQALVPSDADLKGVRRIWNDAPHNAFTDLEQYGGNLYVTFREASRHGVPPVGSAGGNIRVLRSSNGVNWSSAASISFGVDNDLRDPKLSITPDNRLMLVGINQPHQLTPRQSYAWFSTNGSSWSAAAPTIEQPRWLWRVEWRDGAAYGISYTSSQTRLHASTNGVDYTTRVNSFGSGNEGSLLFRNDGSAVALVRREGTTARVGTSSGDLTSWTWRDASHFVGGPGLIELPDRRIVVGGRFTDGVTRTSLAFLNPSTGALSEFLTLPSGGDTGYPGLAWHDEKLWVSYYSSHEGRSSIYLATVTFASVPEPSTAAVLTGGAMLMLAGRRTRRGERSIPGIL